METALSLFFVHFFYLVVADTINGISESLTHLKCMFVVTITVTTTVALTIVNNYFSSNINNRILEETTTTMTHFCTKRHRWQAILSS